MKASTRPWCPYCHQRAELATGTDIYPHRLDLAAKRFWRCAPCKAYVGCHGQTTVPLGRLADAELRHAKKAAHAAFDLVWRSGILTRADAYAWLAETLRIRPNLCHIGMFDVAACTAVVDVVKTKYPEFFE